MALFLGGGRPLLAGIMTLVMVDPLTSSLILSTSRRGSRFKPGTPEGKRKKERKRKIWFEQIEWSRPSLGTRGASRLRNDVGFAKRKWPFKNALKIYMLSITVFKYFLILVTLKVG